jgi:hypothetical protein
MPEERRVSTASRSSRCFSLRVLITADVRSYRLPRYQSDIGARPDALIRIRSGRMMIARACIGIFCRGLFLSPAVAGEARAQS